MLRPEYGPTGSAVAQPATTPSATSAHPGPVAAAANPCVLAIDPGNTHSGFVVIDAATCRPLDFGKVRNVDLLEELLGPDLVATHAAIEMVASYGMPVGREVFETCVWAGRFAQVIDIFHAGGSVAFVTRGPIKLHHCHTSKAKDSNITQALVDRFTPGQSNHGKGTKAAPGWFYGFRADVWQAYAVAVYIADTLSAQSSTPRPHAGVDSAAATPGTPEPTVAAAHPNGTTRGQW